MRSRFEGLSKNPEIGAKPPPEPNIPFHLVFSETFARTVCKYFRTNLAKECGAGYIQVTDGIMPNPYDNLSSGSYKSSMVSEVEGGSLLNADPSSWASGKAAGAVSGLSTLGFD
jgi:hypothetical protein